MQGKDFKFLEKLLSEMDEEKVIAQLSIIQDPFTLHVFAANYNWDNGFNIPFAILENKHCDLGTGLLLFYEGDGYILLVNEKEVLTSENKEWKIFLHTLYKKLMNLDFHSQQIAFDSGLTKVQKFKLQKENPSIEEVFINISQGVEVDTRVL
ncbi:DUF4274 domain-containing protein [Priestia endophytica]|uniref:DUF4274 domain-containing protein n=1 Tax=Priestia endophytica TaxID=135735 RepID=UPI0022821FFA|nr:DUF4274 domain-containing protein [Priestia endophytica]MCY8232246.1 DUF4274 domain-containing protein [Priestia endophytica]